MADLFKVTSSPHVHAKATTPRIMWEVFFALVPAAAVAVYAFGLESVRVILITTAACVALEALYQKLAGGKVTAMDGSAALTGLLLALNLPPTAPWWLCLAGAIIAVIIAKALFGGLGQNIFNPALTARVFLLISFPAQMTRWMIPSQAGDMAKSFLGFNTNFIDHGGEVIKEAAKITVGQVDIVTAASPLGLLKEQGAAALGQLEWWHLAVGHLTNGSLGEISAAALLAGGVYLIARRIISWHIPVSFLGTMAVFATITHAVDPARYAGFEFHLAAGGAMLGAFFMATDYVTSPMYPLGKIVFGCGCGALTMIIRLWGGYPEGVSFAILLMNALTPLIDRYATEKKFGFKKEPKEET
ncbi:MAG: RnfABCDGE type electron transport complex subunit D [Pseudomonadota bacterium]